VGALPIMMTNTYAIVDHFGSIRMNPPSISRQELHAANLVIRFTEERGKEVKYTILKDRYNAAFNLFGVTDNYVTRQQADEITIYHASLALKYRRS
jgi:hypothetical protein